jgi:hypothetical protein
MVMTSQNKIPVRADFVKSLRMLPNLSNDQLKQIASNNNDPLSTFAIAVLNSKQISANSAQNANQPTIANQVLAKENTPSGIASLTSPAATMMASNMQAPTESDKVEYLIYLLEKTCLMKKIMQGVELLLSKKEGTLMYLDLNVELV